jgi:hypothetical protein
VGRVVARALLRKDPSVLAMSNTTSFGYPIPAVRKVSALRQRMIDDMTVRNFAPNTQVSYLHQVNLFARHFDKSPERLGPEEIRIRPFLTTSSSSTIHGTRARVSEAVHLRAVGGGERGRHVRLKRRQRRRREMPHRRGRYRLYISFHFSF